MSSGNNNKSPVASGDEAEEWSTVELIELDPVPLPPAPPLLNGFHDAHPSPPLPADSPPPPDPPRSPPGDSPACPEVSTRWDGLVAESLLQEEAEKKLDPDNACTDSRSSGRSSPVYHSSLDVSDAASAAAQSPADAFTEFMDMDLDPRDESTSSSPILMPEASASAAGAPPLTMAQSQLVPVVLAGLSTAHLTGENACNSTLPNMEASAENVFEMDLCDFGSSSDDDYPSTSYQQPPFCADTPLDEPSTSAAHLNNSCVRGCRHCSDKSLPSAISTSRLGNGKPEIFDSRCVRIGGPLGEVLVRDILRPLKPPECCESPVRCFCRSPEGASIYATLAEARRFLTEQGGASNCGEVAVLDALRALRWPKPQLTQLRLHVRARQPEADVAEYLLSRSLAGTTHADLIDAVESLTHRLVLGRFYPGESDALADVCAFVANCIRLGAVAVLTLNLQAYAPAEAQEQLGDAWHHQTAVAATGDGLWLANPLDFRSADWLTRCLTGRRVLLVRAADVCAAWDRGATLTPILRCALEDPRWMQLNVVGQVMHMIRQRGAPEASKVSHVAVPAAYEAGVTVFGHASSDCWQALPPTT